MANPITAPEQDLDDEIVTPVEDKRAEAQTRAEHRSDLARTKAALAAQKKVRVKVQDDTYVAINGYGFLIQGGVKVEVPEQVADLLEEAGRI